LNCTIPVKHVDQNNN